MAKKERTLSEILLSVQVELANSELACSEELQELRLREQRAKTEIAEQQLKYQTDAFLKMDDELSLPKIGGSS